ncbi:hypothetical protein [Paraburkholderia terrae]|uniref:hypothetical protein n=1 Tax=Paraburkholderia terrae TaxID=311230 RepID=UPI0012DFFB97|nr:hypothetical protein [Paraburkholderia terrae]
MIYSQFIFKRDDRDFPIQCLVMQTFGKWLKGGMTPSAFFAPATSRPSDIPVNSIPSAGVVREVWYVIESDLPRAYPQGRRLRQCLSQSRANHQLSR